MIPGAAMRALRTARDAPRQSHTAQIPDHKLLPRHSACWLCFADPLLTNANLFFLAGSKSLLSH
jgi:hypothetical protein